MSEHEHENKILKNRIVELEKQQKDLKDFHYNMVKQLKEKIECPVCMEIPRKGHVLVCPNGHFVCHVCKKDSCPTCRSNMGSNKSILAGTIIDNIEHKCKFEDCDQSFLLPDICKHEGTCPHRTVVCPHPSCTVKVSVSKLISHLTDKKSCDDGKDNILVNLVKNKYCSNYETTRDLNSKTMIWRLKAFKFEDMDFVIFPQKTQGRYYFMIVMLGTADQCSEYRVELELHEYTYNGEEEDSTKSMSIKFCGNPTSIDVEKTKLDSFGISEISMKQVMDESEDKTSSFSLSCTVSKKQ